MNIQLILSRYNEDIQWIKNIKFLFNDIIVYNKGKDEILNENCKILKIPNVGREAQTYLQFIIDNYDNFPDYALFSQAYPLDRGWNKNLNLFISTVAEVVNKKPNLAVLGWTDFETQKIYPPHEWHYNQELKFEEEYEKIFAEKYPERMFYGSGATLWVSKQNVLCRSKEFYVDLNEKTNKHIHAPYAWILERFWLHIFNPKIKSNV